MTNLIKLNYGLLVEGIFPRLREPIGGHLHEVCVAQFQPEGSAIVVDYSSFEHDFQFFRDELRPIYPGVYVGKMYAMPGMSMFGGALQVPIGRLSRVHRQLPVGRRRERPDVVNRIAHPKPRSSREFTLL